MGENANTDTNYFIIQFQLQKALQIQEKDLGKRIIHPMYLFKTIKEIRRAGRVVYTCTCVFSGAPGAFSFFLERIKCKMSYLNTDDIFRADRNAPCFSPGEGMSVSGQRWTGASAVLTHGRAPRLRASLGPSTGAHAIDPRRLHGPLLLVGP